MTGYGKATAELPEKKINVEIKSLNSKAMDLSTRIAPAYREKEIEIRNEISKVLERGKVDFSLWIEKKEGAESATPINQALVEGMDSFDRQIHGFASQTVILTGVESRTSSPVRIERDENLQSGIRGCYPCGEGAGYAGGITSAAMDGIRVAEQIASQFAPLQR